MDSEECIALINCQLDILTRIKKARVNYSKSPKERINKPYIEGRIKNLERLWDDFLSGHKEIIRGFNTKLLATTEYVKGSIYDETEENYSDYECDLKTVLLALGSAENNVSSAGDGRISKATLVKLPKINIPTFTGNYSDWNTFRDLFQSLVHFNVELDNVQKLHYLKGYLSGEAERLLRHISISEVNYDRCWKLLVERYNNKKYLCHNIIKRLLSQKNIFNESANLLKDLIDTTNDCLAALGNLEIDISSWDVVLIHILTLKLDQESRRQWEFSVTDNISNDDLPTYKQFQEFITKRYRALEFLDTRFSGNRPQTNTNNYNDVGKVKSLHVTKVNCSFCKENHKLFSCQEFGKETIEVRRRFIDNKLCFNCLGANHLAKFCQLKIICRTCKKRHNSLLHHDKVSFVATDDENIENRVCDSGDEPSGQRSSTVTCFSQGKLYDQILLATAVVKAKSINGQNYLVRALLDQGSQSSFVTEATVQSLGLKKTPIRGLISGLGGDNNVTSKAIVSIEISSRTDPAFIVIIKAFVLTKITSFLPTNKIKSLDWAELKHMTLADPGYQTPSHIDLLLGADVYGKILQEESYPICLTADIVKMYRQVKVNRNDVDYQRILWSDETKSELKHYRLLTVTFGTASAPYLAVKSLMQVALDEGKDYAMAAERVLRDYYMDDLLTGCENEEEAVEIYKQMNSLLAKAGFQLQKWSSNSTKVTEEMITEKKTKRKRR